MKMPKRKDGLSHDEVLAIKKQKTIDKFLKQAHEKHGDKYDYTQLNYTESRKPITIICPKHGKQEMNMYAHLNGAGCAECAREQQKETLARKFAHLGNEFITKAKNIHGGKYDYSKVKWLNTNHKVEILCPKHGSFWVLPNNHLKGNQCPKCSLENRTLNQEEWLEMAKEKHGDKYDYSEAEYKGFTTPVKIICPRHGPFWQAGGAHAQLGQGCKRCAAEEGNSRNLMTKEEFIAQASKVHNGKYDYSEVKPDKFFKNDEVELICPEHGHFYQRAGQHLLGAGCLKCAGKYKKTTDEFIDKLKEIYGDKYKYDRIVYTNKYENVFLGCPVHGYVRCKPEQLLSGTGCRMCNASNGEQVIEKWLMLHHLPYVRQYRLSNYNYRYDFALPDYKILIEFDGKEHFEPVEYLGGYEAFRKRVQDDLTKTKIAHELGYTLVRLPYTLGSHVISRLRSRIAVVYPYWYNGKFYRSLLDLTKDTEEDDIVNNPATLMEKYKRYKTRLLDG